MRFTPCILLAAVCVVAVNTQERKTKPPFIVDAVGNTLPPPSSGPATVGSPVNLISPDRYEFYTFDESGELVKRLMTLEEIQTIVAAGDEADGLVTFANENQPTVTFNFSQPPYNKVHSVVTNVQNVLKAQMEAHKNKPHLKPTLDTPDVSDSWSLILPSIFGNTGGVDIVPDKNPTTFTTPETETFDLDTQNTNTISKEGNNQLFSSTTTEHEELKLIPIFEASSTTKEVSTTTSSKPTQTSTTTVKTSTTTTPKPTTTTSTTTEKPTTTKITTTTTEKATTTTTTERPTTVTEKVTTTEPIKKVTTTEKPRTTTVKAKVTTTEPIKKVTTTEKPTTTTVKAKITETQSTTKKLTTTTTAPTTARSSTATSKSTYKYTTKAPTSTITTKKYVTVSTSSKEPLSTLANTPKPSTIRPKPTITATKPRPVTQNRFTTSTTSIPRVTTASTTQRLKPSPTTISFKPDSTTGITQQSTKSSTSEPVTTKEENKETPAYDRISTYHPVSTVSYITQRLTERSTAKPTTTISDFESTIKLSTANTPVKTTSAKPLTDSSTITTYKPAILTSFSTNTPTITTTKVEEEDKINTTTLTTQSVSPSTTVSATSEKNIYYTEIKNEEIPPLPPMFDVALSISQIASDLGNNYQPIPTTSDLLDTTKLTTLDLESKENFEIDISDSDKNAASNKTYTIETTTNDQTDNFIKISTIDPHEATKDKSTQSSKYPAESQNEISTSKTTVKEPELIKLPSTTPGTTIDPILSESMDDLLSQIVNHAAQNILEEKKENIVQEEAPPANTANSTLKNEYSTETSKSITSTSPVYEISEKSEAIIEKTTENIRTTYISTTQSQEPTIALSTAAPSTTAAIEIKTVNNNNLNEKKTSTTLDFNSESTSVTTEKYIKISMSTVESNNIPTDTTTITTTTLKEEEKGSSTTANIEPLKDKIENKVENIQNTTESGSNASKLESTTTESNYISTSRPLTDFNNIEPEKEKKEKVDIIKTVENPPKEELKKKFQKVNIDDKELANEQNNSWKLISTVSPPKSNEISKDKIKTDSKYSDDKNVLLDYSQENQGLEVTTKDLSEDIGQFTDLCNELAFRYWHTIAQNVDKKRSFVLSPFSITSMLAMMFMGARGSTSGEMNEILKLDDMVTFNPHFTLKNISDSIETSPDSGVVVSAFIRELYSDKNKGKVLTFYKERAQHFYNGHVEEVNFKLISDIIRRRTNLLVKRYTWGRMSEYMKYNDIFMQPPLAAFSANIFLTDCSKSSVEGRDGEMYFVVSPSVRQRRLVPVPAVLYRAAFLAGYDPALDATAAALGTPASVVTTIFLMPGQQGNVVHAEDLEALEKRLLESNPTTPIFNRLLRTLLPRIGLELQIPRFSHKSIFNVSSTLKKMGLKDLFDSDHADLGGLIGPSKDLFLSDMVQQTTFVTCGEGAIAEQHHIEEYPDSLELTKRRRTSRWTADWDEPRDYQRAFHDPHDLGEAMNLPLHLRPRQARLPSREAQPARLKFDRPFLYFVRHNPTGMILYVGRYNPRLLP